MFVEMTWLPLCLSFMASFVSSISLLGLQTLLPKFCQTIWPGACPSDFFLSIVLCWSEEIFQIVPQVSCFVLFILPHHLWPAADLPGDLLAARCIHDIYYWQWKYTSLIYFILRVYCQDHKTQTDVLTIKHKLSLSNSNWWKARLRSSTGKWSDPRKLEKCDLLTALVIGLVSKLTEVFLSFQFLCVVTALLIHPCADLESSGTLTAPSLCNPAICYLWSCLYWKAMCLVSVALASPLDPLICLLALL